MLDQPSILIYNARIITPLQVLFPVWIQLDKGIIHALGTSESLPDADLCIDGKGSWVLPGFIDIHIHGTQGADTMDATSESLNTISEAIAKHGVTSFLPTTVTSSHDQTLASLVAIKETIQQQSHTPPRGAQILGAHLEGPYISTAQSGAQSKEHIREFSVSEFNQYVDTGVLRIVSFAPEIHNSQRLIEVCKQHAIITSLAHTNASYEQAIEAIAHGVQHSTHTFNAMTELHHRQPGTVGAILTSTTVVCELICDNHHIHPIVQKMLWQIKGHDNIILVTDAMRATSMPDNEYRLGDYTVRVQEGIARLPDGTLAGSTLHYDQGVRNFIANTTTHLPDIWRTTSYNAAKSLGIADHKGNLNIGSDADIVVLSEELEVMMTIVTGNIIYQKEEA